MVGPDNAYKITKIIKVLKEWMTIKIGTQVKEDSNNLIKIAKKIMGLISF